MTMFSNVTPVSGADPYSPEDDSLSDFPEATDSKPWDTSDPIISASTRDLLQRVLTCYIRQPIVFVGIVGNILCCAVFLKQDVSDRITLLLFCLAVTDLFNLLSQLCRMPVCYLPDPLQAANWSVVVLTYITLFNWWLTFVSGLLMLLLSVDRCLSVAAPFRAKRLLQYRLTVAAIVVSYLLSLAFSLSHFLAFTVRWRTDPSTNHSIAYKDTTSWFPMESSLAESLMRHFNLVTKPVLLVIMIVCCTVTIVHLRRASRTRLKMGGNVTEEAKSGDNRITVMLLVICGAYMILIIPDISANYAVRFNHQYYVFRKYHNSRVVHFQFIWIASCLNSAINFLPYVLLSSRFQRTLRDLCFCCVKKKV